MFQGDEWLKSLSYRLQCYTALFQSQAVNALHPTSAVIYDYALGSSDDINSANPQAIAGGIIVIHK